MEKISDYTEERSWILSDGSSKEGRSTQKTQRTWTNSIDLQGIPMELS